MFRNLSTLILFFCLSVSFGEMIGDFAPIKLGNTWEYKYDDQISGWKYEHILSQHIILSISKIDTIGIDTIVQLKVMQDSSEYYNRMGTVHRDSGSSLFFDTAVVKHDSILKSAGYRCLVFPFQKKHFISRDSLQVVNIDDLTLADEKNSRLLSVYSTDSMVEFYNDPGVFSYIPDIGLYSRGFGYSSDGGRYNGGINIQLISFNGSNILVDTNNHRVKVNRQNQKSVAIKHIEISQRKQGYNRQYFNISGRTIPQSTNYPQGIFLTLPANKDQIKH